MIRRMIECDICEESSTERSEGEGWPGWGQFMGINLDGVNNPNFCPNCLAVVAEFIDRLQEKY